MGRALVFAVYCCILGFAYAIKTGVINGHDPYCTIEDEDDFKYGKCEERFSREYYCTLDQSQRNWLQTLYEEAFQSPPQMRTRREIRTLSESDRESFLKAVNDLKSDTTVKPNKYDTLALIHTNHTLCSAHHGSNFLGWHRIYLLMFETALRQKNKLVSLPYWNSAMDFYEGNETLPVLFSDDFLGQGHGDVNSGPFKDWVDIYNCTLKRNIGNGKSILPSPIIIDDIETNLTIYHVRDVTLTNSSYKYTIEGQHDRTHDWIGGMMGILSSSPKDPAFFLHHAFIDYVWEQFREKQMSLGRDPETDYPAVADVKLMESQPYDLTNFHTPDRMMDCFPWFKNIDGYWNNFTQNLYQYEKSPTCPDCGHSKYLECNEEHQMCIGISAKKVLRTQASGASGVYTMKNTLFLFFSLYTAIFASKMGH